MALSQFQINRLTGVPVFTTVNGKKHLTLCSDAQAVAQTVWLRLTRIKGECSMDLESGLPWTTDFAQKPYNEDLVRQIIMDELLTIPGVTSVDRCDLTLDSDRELHVSLKINGNTEVTA